MSSSNHWAEIWIEVNGARLPTVRDRDGVDIAIVDFDPNIITPYSVCGRMKQEERGYDKISAFLIVDGREGNPTVGPENPFRLDCINDDSLGFAPLSSVPNGGNSDADLQHLGLIEVTLENARAVGYYHDGFPEAVLFEGPKLTANEGKKALFGMQTVSAGKLPTNYRCASLEMGTVSTRLKIRYASRMALKLKGLLPSENIHREVATVDLSSSSFPASDVKPKVNPRPKPIIIDLDDDSDGWECGVVGAKRPAVIDLTGDANGNDANVGTSSGPNGKKSRT